MLIGHYLLIYLFFKKILIHRELIFWYRLQGTILNLSFPRSFLIMSEAFLEKKAIFSNIMS